jgi:NADH-quinone oxidoreductase subunit M
MMVTLAVLVIGVGVWPYPLIDMMEASIQNLVAHIVQSKVA